MKTGETPFREEESKGKIEKEEIWYLCMRNERRCGDKCVILNACVEL